MRHVDHRVLELLVQTLDFHAKIGAQFSIKVRERLVEEKHVHVTDKRSANCNTLALATRKSSRFAVQERFDLEDLSSTGNALFDFRSWDLGVLKTERQVPFYGHLRIECIALEHHADATVARLCPSDVVALNVNLARRDFEKTCDTVQERGLTATRGTKQNNKLALLDI